MIRFVALACIIIPAIVDWSDIEVINDRWLARARLEDAMSSLMAAGLGAGALYLTFRIARRDAVDIAIAALLCIWPWASFLLAGVFPGASYGDAVAGDVAPIGAEGVAAVAILPLAMIGLGLLGWWLAHDLFRGGGTSRGQPGEDP
ncbi:MAG: hypothetical protein AAF264_01250 [Pseudomonadota bacterium]